MMVEVNSLLSSVATSMPLMLRYRYRTAVGFSRRTDSSQMTTDNSLWKSSAVSHVGGSCLAEKRSSEQANRVQVSTVPVVLQLLESGRNRQVGHVSHAPSMVSRRADKTSGQRVAMKSSKEEFVLQ